MPLYSNAERVIRENLAAAREGRRAKPIVIGRLSDAQLLQLNFLRAKSSLPPIDGAVFFRGNHIFNSRVYRDGYSVDDVLTQIFTAFSDESIVRFNAKMTTLQSAHRRLDGYGNLVQDECVLECTGRFPKAELFSIIPKGDRIKPSRK